MTNNYLYFNKNLILLDHIYIFFKAQYEIIDMEFFIYNEDNIYPYINEIVLLIYESFYKTEDISDVVRDETLLLIRSSVLFDYHMTFVCKYNNEIVSVFNALRTNDMVIVHNGCTKNIYQNMGFMKALIKYAINEISGSNIIKHIIIECKLELIKFYEKFNFKINSFDGTYYEMIFDNTPI